ncbi:MAG: transposase [Candidatus Lokiarchaeota archaeon]|nr:transposase [Candidatus Lokiarchaeota archaeon]
MEARNEIKEGGVRSLAEFNTLFKKWVEWYNTEKPHRSLPEKGPPGSRYFATEWRVFQPLEVSEKWKRWMAEVEVRRVNKSNEISYKSQKYALPPGYSGVRVEIVEYDDKIDIYYRDHLVQSRAYTVPTRKRKETRKIANAGTIGYKGKYHTIDYKLAGKTVEVQEINGGKNLLVYLNGVLLKTLDL